MTAGNGNAPQHTNSSNEKFVESMMNLALLDPPRWGWPALGPVTDLLSPHERARRKGSKKAFKKSNKRKRGRPPMNNSNNNNNSPIPSANTTLKPPPPPSQASLVTPQAARVNQSNSVPAAVAATALPSGAEQGGAKSLKQDDGTPKNLQSSGNGEKHDTDKAAQKAKAQSAVGAKEGDVMNIDVATSIKMEAATEAADKSAKDASAQSEPNDGSAPPPQTKTDSTEMQVESNHLDEIAPKSQLEKDHVESAPPQKAEPGSAQDQSAELQTKVENAASQPAQGGTTPQPVPTILEPASGQAKVATSSTETAMQPQTAQTQAEEKQPEPEIEIYEKGTDPNVKVVKTRALSEKGLDIYAYHRGREGMEPRDPATGELVCDVEPTDTNYKLDEPRLSLNVTVKFPLVDEEDSKRGNKVDWPMFEDTIPWDLGDPETPTPMAFAVTTAETFGLTFGQTVDLATYIQDQIYRHIREHCGYAEPVALTDGAGTERIQFPRHSIPHLYGAVCQNEVVPGTRLAEVQPPSSRGKARSAARASSTSNNQGTTSRRSSMSGNSGGRSQSRPPPVLYEEEDPIEEVYVEEVKRRLVEISKADVLAKSPDWAAGPLGCLEMRENWVCHICHKRNKLVGVFACGHATHSYCGSHLRDRLGLPVRKLSDKVTFDHCPICSVTCTCSKCKRRLEALAFELRRLSKEQGVEAGSTVFENIKNSYTRPISSIRVPKVGGPKRRDSNASSATEASSRVSSERDKQQKPPPRTKGGRKSGEDKLVNVKKVAPTEFPREIHARGNSDVDPGTRDDYLTVFTADGSYMKAPDTLPLPRKPRASADPSVVAEDGNVDYCQKCRTHGNLICCDFCPRAYHAGCRDGDGSEGADGRWECHKCFKEREGLPEYTLTGSESQEAICRAYQGLKSTRDDDLTQLSILCKIHEMVSKLLKSDFGYIFLEPVDLNEVPNYRSFIKQPMDLGTVAKRLVSGYYATFFEKNMSWAQVHLAVLKDIELVWQNCLTYNFEGSAVYRMAEVTRRLMLGMRRRSLDKDLDPHVKEKLDAFVRTKERERGKSSSTKYDNRPKSRHKIQVKGHGGVARKVAILDPDTGMIVKMYTTIRSASIAAEFMADTRGHKSEFPLVNYHSVKALINDRSAQDPTATLFGYRWLDYDTLRDGGVSFSTTKESMEPAVIEMINGEAIYIFLSVDEALSSPQLPTELSTDVVRKGKLRNDLHKLPEGGDGMSDSGLKWRRHKPLGSSESIVGNELSLSSFYAGNEGKKTEPLGKYLPDSVIIVKEDVTLPRTLAGFETRDAAFDDWEAACKASPTVLSEEITRPNFDNYYLDGERNVDGIVWKTADRTTLASANPSAAKQPKGALSVETGAQDATGDAPLVMADGGPSTGSAAQSETNSQNGDSEEKGSASGEDGTDGESVPAADTEQMSDNSENPSNSNHEGEETGGEHSNDEGEDTGGEHYDEGEESGGEHSNDDGEESGGEHSNDDGEETGGDDSHHEGEETGEDDSHHEGEETGEDDSHHEDSHHEGEETGGEDSNHEEDETAGEDSNQEEEETEGEQGESRKKRRLL